MFSWFFTICTLLFVIVTLKKDKTEKFEQIATDEHKAKALQYAVKQLCIRRGYTPVETAQGWDCVHNEKSCKEASLYPVDSNNAFKYLEWRPHENRCVIGDAAYRATCEQDKLTYNPESGECKTNEAYCKSKFVTWRNNDCYVPPLQKVTEGIFGTTVGRALSIANPLTNLERVIYKN